MAAGRAGPARRPLHRRASSRSRPSRRTSPSALPSPRAMSRPASSEAEVIDRAAATPPSRCTRPISSRMPASCSVGADGQCTIWSSSQGQFMVRAYCAKLLGIDIANIRAIPAEIGGGFGGKTLVYLEPVALALSKKTGRPVKMRDEPRGGVPRHRPDRRARVIEVKLGAKKDGTHRRGRSSCSSTRPAPSRARRSQPGCMCGFAMYDIPNVEVVGYDVVSQPAEGRRLPRARRAELVLRRPRAASTSWPASSASTRSSCARSTRAKDGTKAAHGPTWANIGYHADAGGGEGARAPEDAARAEPGPRHRLRLLVQHRRRVERGRATSTRTARSASSRATPTSAARAPRWR